MVKAVFFDFMGTCLDWHSSVVQSLPPRIPRDEASKLALEWRRQYFIENDRRFRQNLAPEDIDQTLHHVLEKVLEQYPNLKPQFNAVAITQAIEAWHSQPAWPEVQKAIQTIRDHMGLETFVHANGCYKPNPEAYEKALQLVKLKPEEVVLVAAHAYDLRGAQRVGLKTIYIHRWTDDIDENMESIKNEFDVFLENMDQLPAAIARI